MASESPLSASQQMRSSSVGALMVSLFTTPFDVVKVRMQAQLKPSSVKCSTFGTVVDSICFCSHKPAFNSPVMCTIYGNIQTVPRFSSNVDAFVKIAKVEGIQNLWKGLSPTFVQMVPQTVIYYTLYDQVKVKFGYVEGEANFYAPLFSGVFSRSLAVFAVSPVEMIRTKFQSRYKLGYREMSSMLVNSIKVEGVSSMWRGIGPTLLRDVPFSAVFWIAYEYLKSLAKPSFTQDFLSGAFSGMIAAFITQPFDVVKTHRQMELGEIKSRDAFRKLPFTFAILKTLYKSQGIASLYTGAYPRILKVTPACAIMISTYEYGKRYFRRQNEDSLISTYGNG